MPYKNVAVLFSALAVQSLAAASALDPLVVAARATKPIVDTRLRFEGVEQEPLADEAEAITLRARVGFETGKAWNTALLVEGEAVWPWRDDYNSTLNGKTNYPAVPDPESYEINRAQLSNTSIPGTTLTLGRQRIVLDDHRFVGNVGWRQNEQTFDALRIVNRSIANLTVDLTYLNQVNRVFGKESPQGRYHGASVLANVSYQLGVGKLTAFGYRLEFDSLAGVPAAVRDSSQTLGLRFAGERPVGPARFGYVAAFARQEEAGDNPLAFENDYRMIELSGTYRQYSLGAGIEVLEGNGTKGFTTPLATLHRFQGWADKFLATPAEGIEDLYVNLGVSLQQVGPLASLGVQASYHWYEAERVRTDYGKEANLQLQAKWQRLLATLKYADYASDSPLTTDTSKFWLQLEYTF